MFKKSIRLRITSIFIAITALLILSLFLCNQFFLTGFYLYEKIETLETAYESISGLVKDADLSETDLSEFIAEDPMEADSMADAMIRRFTDRSNIDVVILNPETNSSIGFSRETDWLISKLKAYSEFADAIEQGQIPDSKYRLLKKTDNYAIQLNFDPRSGQNNLECWGTLSDTDFLFLMVMPVESIKESAAITNRFILIVGLVLLGLGSVLIYFATAYITKPIDQLASISSRMSRLDFSEKYTGKHQDEIGVLGRSMNTMSDQLEKTILDLKKANTELQEANKKLQEDINLKEKIDHLRKDFISNVSHELKTPIALIEGYAEGLTEGIAEDPESRDYYCNVIMDEASKMNKMVKQLTTLTQYEFGEADLSIDRFDLVTLAKNVLEKEKLRIEEKQAVLCCNFPESCTVNADEFKIEEVLTNYLTNALNHIGGERRIIVSIKLQEENTVRLSVYNDGEPIPQDSLSRIWEKFYKVDKARTRAYGGSGIGLSIVKAIADAHHRKCGVENKKNGVEFYIELDSSF